MIRADNATKRFDDITAVDHICAEVQNASVYGLIGSNGAGKSTFLRMLAGILEPDEGEVWIDGEKIFENTAVKSRCFFISDEQFFFPNSTPQDMKNYYRRFYEKFDEQRYFKLMSAFGLDEMRKIRTFSKGMKKQVSVICGVCSGADYLFCDETFDGLDPVVGQEPVRGGRRGARSDAGHREPQPARTGGHLRPCGSAASRRHPVLARPRRDEARYV